MEKFAVGIQYRWEKIRKSVFKFGSVAKSVCLHDDVSFFPKTLVRVVEQLRFPRSISSF